MSAERVRVLRPADSADRAYAAIRRLVVDFRFRPDERINEVQLAAQIGLSRTPIREALNRLASEGFLIFSPNRGFVFRALDIDDLVHLFELRTIVETGAFRLACMRGDREAATNLSDFWREAHEAYRSADPDEILDLDEAFHVTLARASGNPEIVRHLQAVNARIRFVRRVQIERGRKHASMIDEHTEIAKALQCRDVWSGTDLLSRHIAMTVEDARSALAEAIGSCADAKAKPA